MELVKVTGVGFEPDNERCVRALPLPGGPPARGLFRSRTGLAWVAATRIAAIRGQSTNRRPENRTQRTGHTAVLCGDRLTTTLAAPPGCTSRLGRSGPDLTLVRSGAPLSSAVRSTNDLEHRCIRPGRAPASRRLYSSGHTNGGGHGSGNPPPLAVEKSGWQESNLRPPRPKRGALHTAPHPRNGGGGGNRTHDQRRNRPSLYP